MRLLFTITDAIFTIRQMLAAKQWQNTGLGRQTFPILRQSASWMGDHSVVKPSANSQPTQLSIPQGSVNE